jgi:hypothetical protein
MEKFTEILAFDVGTILHPISLRRALGFLDFHAEPAERHSEEKY